VHTEAIGDSLMVSSRETTMLTFPFKLLVAVFSASLQILAATCSIRQHDAELDLDARAPVLEVEAFVTLVDIVERPSRWAVALV
jgi:hypothetical protein